jgi:hypothetical protein
VVVGGRWAVESGGGGGRRFKGTHQRIVMTSWWSLEAAEVVVGGREAVEVVVGEKRPTDESL